MQAIHIAGKSYPGISVEGLGFALSYNNAAEILGITFEQADDAIEQYRDEFTIPTHVIFTDAHSNLLNLGHIDTAETEIYPMLTARGFARLSLITCCVSPEQSVITAFQNPLNLTQFN